MNWISNVVRPKIRSFLNRRESPENLWIKCPETGQLVFFKDVETNHFVIPSSNYHMRMGANARLKSIFDDGEWEDIPVQRGRGRPAEIPRRAPLRRPPQGRPRQDRPRRCREGRRRHARRPSGRDRRAGFRFHGRLARHGGRRGRDCGSRDRREARHAVHHVRGVGRRAHAGGDPLADAASAHDRRGRDAARRLQALHRRAHQPDHRRRHRVLRDARRRPHRRARRADRLCRAARHRADHPREIAGRVPEIRIPARSRHGRHGGASPHAAADARQSLPGADQDRKGAAACRLCRPCRRLSISPAPA